MSFAAPNLTTDRLLLRELAARDREAIFAMMSDPTVMRYWDAPPWRDPERAEAFVSRSHELAQEETGMRLAIERENDGSCIGWIALQNYDPDFRLATITYVLAQGSWGAGYASEAGRAIIDWAFETLDVNRIQTEVDTRNAASARVLEKLGFQREGTLRQNCIVAGEVSDSWFYGLLREDWVTADAPASRDERSPVNPWPRKAGPLTLREATAADIEQLLTFRNDPAVNRFMMRTSVDPEEFRRAWSAIPHSATDFSCVAERDGDVVAMGFLDRQDASGQPGKPRGTEALIGYIVDPSAWRTGVAGDLVRGLLAAAFDSLGVRRVVAYCNADNPGSVRSLEKAGMRREQHGIEDCWHAELGWVDGYQYAMLEREWRDLAG